jgi:hypothetical protein
MNTDHNASIFLSKPVEGTACAAMKIFRPAIRSAHIVAVVEFEPPLAIVITYKYSAEEI